MNPGATTQPVGVELVLAVQVGPDLADHAVG